MPAQHPLFQEVYRKIDEVTRPAHVRKPAVTRLALLVTGIVAAESCVPYRTARRLRKLAITRATKSESIERRLRRILNDDRLVPETCYHPAFQDLIEWERLRRRGLPVVLIVDESSKGNQLHLLSLSLAYWGTSVPLVWRIWEQNVPLPAGRYWQEVEALLAAAKAVVPVDIAVVVLADRAFDVPGFIDRVAAVGWHWGVRAKINGSERFCDRKGREHRLGDMVRTQVSVPGQRWKRQGQVFKNAGWRDTSVVAVWERGQKAPLAVLSDLPPQWRMVTWYDHRFWCEPGFRNIKSAGWQWEDSQVTDLDHQARLLLGMAWATLLAICAGREEASAHMRAEQQRQRERNTPRKQPDHARESLFTLGLDQLAGWLYQTMQVVVSWCLPHPESPSWNECWQQAQLPRASPQTVRP